MKMHAIQLTIIVNYQTIFSQCT